MVRAPKRRFARFPRREGWFRARYDAGMDWREQARAAKEGGREASDAFVELLIGHEYELAEDGELCEDLFEDKHVAFRIGLVLGRHDASPSPPPPLPLPRRQRSDTIPLWPIGDG